MHILLVEALLIATYSTWGWANTYTHRKTLSVENLSRANSWSLSSCTFPAGSCPADRRMYERTSVRAYERTSLRIATEARPVRNSFMVLRQSFLQFRVSTTSDAKMDFSRSLAGHSSRYIMKG